MLVAKSRIKHNGVYYEAGDRLPEMPEHELKPLLEAGAVEEFFTSPQFTKSETIPDYLQPFWRFYNALLKEGWFERTEAKFDDKSVPLVMGQYGKTLIGLVRDEKDVKRKYELFSALSVLVDFLGGELK